MGLVMGAPHGACFSSSGVTARSAGSQATTSSVRELEECETAAVSGAGPIGLVLGALGGMAAGDRATKDASRTSQVLAVFGGAIVGGAAGFFLFPG
jgi:hypothetical protein